MSAADTGCARDPPLARTRAALEVSTERLLAADVEHHSTVGRSCLQVSEYLVDIVERCVVGVSTHLSFCSECERFGTVLPCADEEARIVMLFSTTSNVRISIWWSFCG
jgi:hypothetical protein